MRHLLKRGCWAGASLGVAIGVLGCGGPNAAQNSTAAGHAATPSQAGTKKNAPAESLGVKVIRALMAQPSLKNAAISVGTGKDTVTLNGTVANAAQSKLAESIARRAARGYKIVNSLRVGGKAPAKAPAKPAAKVSAKAAAKSPSKPQAKPAARRP